jgi:hypothetical protein
MNEELSTRITRLDFRQLEAIERQARTLRSQAVGELIQDFMNWVERAIWQARQRDYASFLSRATDHADLERRMRVLHQPTRPLAG